MLGGGGIFDSAKNLEENNQIESPEGATQPTNTSGYWTDSGRYGTTEWSGIGSKDDPYLIKTAKDLARLSYMVYSGSGTVTDSKYFYSGKYFKQTADIDLSSYYWQPIGIIYDRNGTTTSKYFSGNYDGGGHTVSGVFTKAGTTDAYSYQGLFGRVQGESTSKKATISNVGVVNSNIKGYYYVSGIVGNAFSSTVITNCYNTGSVSGDGYVAGIVGNGNITVSNCYNTGSVTGARGGFVGGIVGYSENITISNSYNMGSVKGNSSVGGIIGGGYGNITVTNSYNTGEISGTVGVGGIVGYVNSSTTVINCFNTGRIGGSGYRGGLVGYSGAPTVYNCYYGGDCTLSIGVGNGTDKGTKIANLNTTSYAKAQAWYTSSANWDSDYLWDFVNTWAMIASLNNGYPVLKTPYKLTWDSQGGSAIDQDYITVGEPYGKNNIYDYSKINHLTGWTISGNKLDLNITNNGTSPAYYNFKYQFDGTLKSSTTYTAVINVEKLTGTLYLAFTSAYDSSGIGDMFDTNYVVNILYSGTYKLQMTTQPTISADTEQNYRSYVVLPPKTSISATMSVSVFTGLYNYSGTFNYASLGNSPSASALPTPTRAGYIFKGWYTGQNGSGTKIEPTTIFSSTFDQTLYANWEQEQVNVILNQAGGMGGVSSIKVTPNSSMPTLTSLPTKEGYNFMGYYSGQNGSGTKYYNADGTSATTYTLTTGTTLYAHWVEKTWVDYVTVTDFGGGTGDVNDPYIISTPQHLALLAKNVNNEGNKYEGKFFKQTADLNLGGYEWEPISHEYGKPFSGNYDGSDYSIIGMTITQPYQYIGLFGYSTKSVFKNINVKNAVINNTEISTSAGIGGILGFAGFSSEGVFVSIEDCSFNGMINLSSGVAGGICGLLYGSSLTNCRFDGQIAGSGDSVGGMVGQHTYISNGTISDCFVDGYIESTNSSACVGGIVGRSYAGLNLNTSLINATIKTSGAAASTGALIGFIENANSYPKTINDCAGFGMIYSNNTEKTGTLFGYTAETKNITFNRCSFVGSSNNALNFAGTTSTAVEINNCYSQVNEKGEFKGNDFSGWTIVKNMNNNLPMQNALYSVAIGGQTSEYIVGELEKLGFTAV